MRFCIAVTFKSDAMSGLTGEGDFNPILNDKNRISYISICITCFDVGNYTYFD